MASFADFGVRLLQIAQIVETGTILIRQGLTGRRSETCGLAAWGANACVLKTCGKT